MLLFASNAFTAVLAGTRPSNWSLHCCAAANDDAKRSVESPDSEDEENSIVANPKKENLK